MPKTIYELIDSVIQKEGRYVDHPADRGGPTNWGVTQKTLSAWFGRPASVDDVKNLTVTEAREIYRQRYYVDPKIYDLPEPWQGVVLDWAVNSGPGAAIRELQRLCQAHGCEVGKIDGVIGPKTVAASRKLLATPLHWYLNRRREFFRKIVEADATQGTFLKGWLARVDALEKEMVG